MILILFIILFLKVKDRKLTKFNNGERTPFSKKELIFKITLSAIFIALGAVLKTFSISTGEMRLSFFEIPLFLSGMILGPIFGGLVGLGADLIYSIFSGYAFSPIMMCSAILWGVSGSIFYKKKSKLVSTLILCLFTTSLATTINSVQLYIYYGMGMFANLPSRVITMLVKWPIISISVWLLNERIIKSIINKIVKRKYK